MRQAAHPSQNTFQPVYDYLERQTKRVLLLHGGSLVAFVGLLDYATGPELSFYVFYFVPIMLVTAYAGWMAGLQMSFLGAVVWAAADFASGAVYSHLGVRFWNILIRFLSFVLVASMQHLLGRERYLARTDFLTKLANRQYFYEVAEREISRSKRYDLPLTVAYIDLDNFKKVNDTRGHSMGNRLLRTVGDTLQQHIRDVDTAARLGGDEFALILPQSDEVAGRAVLQKVHKLLNSAMHDNKWAVTFSIGVVTFHKIPETVRELIKEADSRMYAVKNSGKNAMMFDVLQ